MTFKRFICSDGTSLGLELKPVYSSDEQLPEYLETNLLTRELTNIFLRGTNVLLDKHPVNVDQARVLQDTWQGETRVYSTAGSPDDEIIQFYRENKVLHEIKDEDEMLFEINSCLREFKMENR